MGNMGNMQKMMKQMQKMQKEMMEAQEQLGEQHAVGAKVLGIPRLARHLCDQIGRRVVGAD